MTGLFEPGCQLHFRLSKDRPNSNTLGLAKWFPLRFLIDSASHMFTTSKYISSSNIHIKNTLKYIKHHQNRIYLYINVRWNLCLMPQVTLVAERPLKCKKMGDSNDLPLRKCSPWMAGVVQYQTWTNRLYFCFRRTGIHPKYIKIPPKCQNNPNMEVHPEVCHWNGFEFCRILCAFSDDTWKSWKFLSTAFRSIFTLPYSSMYIYIIFLCIQLYIYIKFHTKQVTINCKTSINCIFPPSPGLQNFKLWRQQLHQPETQKPSVIRNSVWWSPVQRIKRS